jgi:outer membrane protein assembly factor BamB
MTRSTILAALTAVGVVLPASAQDWPQWRGANRDAKAIGFKAPARWPATLEKEWSVAVGDGVATPALVGDRLYVFGRQEGNEVVRCLDAKTGKEIWQDKYPAKAATGPASGFGGPRSSPTVADGKVVTLGVSGTLSCYDAAGGKLLWRNEDYKDNVPAFFVSSSPIIADGLCIGQMGGGDMAGRGPPGGAGAGGGGAGRPGGGRPGGGGMMGSGKGAIVAFDLASGKVKWKWDGDGTAYASPVVCEIEGVKQLVAETARNIVALSVADGNLLWQVPYPVEGGRGYTSASPIVEGNIVIASGSNRGTKVLKIEKQGSKLTAKELWNNKDNSVIYNTPVVKDGLLFGLSSAEQMFCINLKTGKTAWTAPFREPAAGQTPQEGAAKTPPGKGPPGKGGMGGRGMRGGGYGSIVDAGPVLLALTPAAQLVVFEPSDKGYKKLATYKVAEGDTYAYPVAADNRIYVKDKDTVTMWRVE